MLFCSFFRMIMFSEPRIENGLFTICKSLIGSPVCRFVPNSCSSFSSRVARSSIYLLCVSPRFWDCRS